MTFHIRKSTVRILSIEHNGKCSSQRQREFERRQGKSKQLKKTSQITQIQTPFLEHKFYMVDMPFVYNLQFYKVKYNFYTYKGSTYLQKVDFVICKMMLNRGIPSESENEPASLRC